MGEFIKEILIQFFNIIFPEEWLLRAIIFAIVVLAYRIWRRCHAIKKQTRINLTLLEATNSVAELVDALKWPNMGDRFYDDKFEEFKNKIKTANNITEGEGEEVFDHLKSIYDAGYQGSHLDAKLLVNNTIGKIFAGIDTTRTYISLFLVLGILGTLIGMALSFNNLALAGANAAAGTGDFAQGILKNTKDMSDIIRVIAGRLKGAFTPSMWGVSLTIIFVRYFSKSIQDGCINELTAKLTNNTVNSWVPALYPTVIKESKNSLAQLNETIRNAHDINTGTSLLLNNLENANVAVNALRDTANSIKECHRAFANGAKEFSKLQITIAAMSQQNQSRYVEFTDFINTSVTQWKDALEKQNDELREQNSTLNAYLHDVSGRLLASSQKVANNYAAQAAQVDSLLQTLRTYDKHYWQVQDGQQERLKESIAQNKAATVRIDTMTGEMIAAVGQPLKNMLANELKRMSGALEQGLKEVSSNLETKVGRPLQQQLASDLMTVSSNLEVTTGRLTALESTLSQGLAQVGDKLEDNLGAKVGEPLRQQLAGDLEGISGKLDVAADKLQDLNNPLVQVQGELSKMFCRLEMNLEHLVEGMEEKFNQLMGRMAAKGGVEPVTENRGASNMDTLVEKLAEVNAPLIKVAAGIQDRLEKQDQVITQLVEGMNDKFTLLLDRASAQSRAPQAVERVVDESLHKFPDKFHEMNSQFLQLQMEVAESFKNLGQNFVHAVGDLQRKADSERERLGVKLDAILNQLRQQEGGRQEELNAILNQLKQQEGGRQKELDVILNQLKQQESRREEELDKAQPRGITGACKRYLPVGLAILVVLSIVFLVLVISKVVNMPTIQTGFNSDPGKTTIEIQEEAGKSVNIASIKR